jgi:hypothetical protein
MINNKNSQPKLADGSLQFQLDGANEKLTDWTEEPSLLVLKGDFEAAKSAHDAQISKINRWNSLRDITGSAKPPGIKGRSAIQPKLIRRQAEWRYAALSEPFLSSDKLFKVSPVTFEDEAAARQNELVLNYQFRTKLDRTWLIDNIVRAQVDEGTCIARTGWKRVTTMIPVEVPVFEHYAISSEEEIMQLQQVLELRMADPRTYNEQVPPELKAAVDYLEETQIPTIAKQVGVKTVEEEKIIENKPTVEIVNPANVYVDPSCNGDLDKALFVIVSFETNKADLLKEGDRYKNLDKVNWEGNSSIVSADHSTETPDSFQFRDATRKKIVAYEYWGFYDIHGNGTLEPFVATWIGDTVIRMDGNPYPDKKLPFVMIPYLPVKRELYGEPDAEVLEDNQRILGAVTRGMIDLLGQSANGQRGFAKGMLDPLNRRRYENGQDYEFNPAMPTSQGIIEHKYPELPQSALLMLNLQNAEAESITGVKNFAGGLSGESYGVTSATSVRGVLDASAKREMAILRRLAKGVCDIGRKIMAMNAEFLSEVEVVRVTNDQFVSVAREELAGEFDLIVDISTFEVDNTKAQDLGFMLQTLGPNMDPQISMTILAEIAELKRMPALAQKLRTWQPQPDPVAEQMKQMELQRMQVEIQKLESEVMLNQARAQQAISIAGLKELDRVEQETGTKHARNIVEQQAQARGNMNLETLKSLIKPRKPGESVPDVTAAIGYNELSARLEEERLLGNNNPPAQPVNQ